jgi:hypothetical protein
LNELGECLEFGDCGGKDISLAADCYGSAAGAGHSGAEANYGFLLEHGLGVERNVSKSIEYYFQSYIQNDAVGGSHCGLNMHFGSVYWEDVESAADFYDMVCATDESILGENGNRCHRAMKKGRSRKWEIDGTTASILHRRNRQSMSGPPISLFKVSPLSGLEAKPLGTGGFGEVTQVAARTKPKQDIARKRIMNCTEQDARREIGNLMKVQHPCIVGLVGWSCGTGNVYEIHLELARGALSKYITQGERDESVRSWAPTWKTIFICNIVLGMRYVHLRGIMHRDLKPGNILVEENWGARICDFGLSWCRWADGDPSACVGTALYAAPEQLTTSSYDEKVDVFAFGLVLYEIVGGFPLSEQGRRDVLSNRLPRFDGTRLMKNLIGRCCSVDPTSRPSFATIFAEFQACQFAILPGVDTEVVSKSVSQVREAESPYLVKGQERLDPWTDKR